MNSSARYCYSTAIHMQTRGDRTLLIWAQWYCGRGSLVPRPHGKASGPGTLLFQVCSAVNEIHSFYVHDACYFLSLRQNKFEIAMFPDHSFYAWSGHETMDVDHDQLCHSRTRKYTISYHPACTLTCHPVISLTPTNERNNVNVSFDSHYYI